MAVMETRRQEAEEVQSGDCTPQPALPANILRAPACNVSVLVRQAPLMDSLCEGPAGSCPPSSRLAGVTILGSVEHETAAALIALTPINAKAIAPRRVSAAGAAHNHEHKLGAITRLAPWKLPVLLHDRTILIIMMMIIAVAASIQIMDVHQQRLVAKELHFSSLVFDVRRPTRHELQPSGRRPLTMSS